MSLSMINKDKLMAAVMLNMMLTAALFVVTVITVSLYADNKQNQKNILAQQAPINITVGIGVAPPVVEVATVENVGVPNTVVVPKAVAVPKPVSKDTTVVVVD